MPPKNNQQSAKPAELPKLDDDGKNFNNWKLRIEKWRIISKVPIKDQAIAVQCTFGDKGFEATKHLTNETLQTKEGLSLLLEALEEFYIPDKLRYRIEVFAKFNTLKRKDNDCVIQHIQTFMNWFQGFKSMTDTPYDDSTLALQLFTSCNMTEEDKKIVSAQMSEPSSS